MRKLAWPFCGLLVLALPGALHYAVKHSAETPSQHFCSAGERIMPPGSEFADWALVDADGDCEPDTLETSEGGHPLMIPFWQMAGEEVQIHRAQARHIRDMQMTSCLAKFDWAVREGRVSKSFVQTRCQPKQTNAATKLW